MHNLNRQEKRSAEYVLIAFSPARDATMKTYKQLTYELLNVSQSTLSQVLLGNTGKRGYRIKQAQTSTDIRRLAACKAIKMTTRLIFN